MKSAVVELPDLCIDSSDYLLSEAVATFKKELLILNKINNENFVV